MWGVPPREVIGTPMAGKSASLTFRLVLRASQPITMSKIFLVASAMPWMGSLPALLTVANVVSVANSNFQLATLVLIIGNILTLATFSKTRLKIRRGPLAVQLPCECRAFILRVEVV